ncbi:MAG: N-acetylmuramoyl-L-alanine amidase [Christensenellaceae bacterium]|nr:N-acetylmuramoyl-L-alanine amidase [Christensenellaceae bacterium]
MKLLRSLPWRHIFDTFCALALVLLLAYAALPFYRSGPLPAEMPALPVELPTQTALMAGYIVVLDAGHGGADGGAVGTKTKVVEKGLNMTVTRLVQEELQAWGVRVLLTRTGDDALADTKKKDMQARKEIMNTAGVDIVVSIHMNKFTDASVKGPMTFYMKGSEAGKQLSEYVIASICERLEYPPRHGNPGDYFVVRETPAPSVLVECGFLSNAEEELLLQDSAYQQKLANGIVAGVIAYLQTLPCPASQLPPSPPPA